MKKTNMFSLVLGLAQTVCILRVVGRLLSTVRGEQLLPVPSPEAAGTGRISVLVPVLNEYTRLSPCLEGLLKQGHEVIEILVADGGSCDGTRALVQEYIQRDPRIRFIDASPIPTAWNGKSWGLQSGLQQVSPSAEWILTLDADVRPHPLLAGSLLAHARKTALRALSVATLQEINGIGLGLLHPALLATLVYRFGIPGRFVRKPHEVQANGQCFFVQRALLEKCGGFACARASICEDVTLARTLVAAGYAVGFYEAGDLVRVEMYQTWQEAWHNWTRSLPLHDQFSGISTWLNWLELCLAQALPLPLFLLLSCFCRRECGLRWLNGIGIIVRLGVLMGTVRAYRRLPWTYWLSPLCDLPVVLKLGSSVLRRRHTWRGRVIIRGGQE